MLLQQFGDNPELIIYWFMVFAFPYQSMSRLMLTQPIFWGSDG